MTKFYVAFSIHGTNQFKVATKETSSIQDLLGLGKVGFSPAGSRRPNYNQETDGIKLHWDKLNGKNGKPLTHKGWVTRRFNELKALGWTLVEPK